MIRIAKPFISDVALDKVNRILKSGNLVQGEYVNQFEKALENYLEADNVVIVSSGTAALHLSLIALGVSPGDEIIIPAFTYTATANVVEIVGAKPVLVDITSDDFCIDCSKIEKVISSKTKAIIPVHEFGNPADMSAIIEISKKYNLKIIEDAACALGTEYNRQKVGTFSEFGCFSFHPRKAITTGEGGAIVTNNNNLADKVRSLRNHGVYKIKNKFDFKYAGYNYRLTDFQAVLGFEQLNDIDNIINKRIKISKYYNNKFKNVKELKTPGILKNHKNVFQTYHLMLDGCIDRDKMIKVLKESGIETVIGAYAIHTLDYYKNKYNYSSNDYEEANKAFSNGIALPIGLHISKKDLTFISKTIKSYISDCT